MARARGRMLSWRISESVKVNGLGDDPWAMLFYTWLIAHCDNLGRFHGEPEQVRGLIFPKQRQVSIQRVTRILTKLASVGLIHWYAKDGLRYCAIPKEDWEREQTLHPNHSRTSEFPSPPDIVRSMYGGPPDNVSHEVEVELELEVEKNLSSARSAAKDSEHPYFPAFYAEYPRRTKRREAARAFAQAIRRHAATTDPDDIAAAAKSFAVRMSAEGREDRFIPHPATWLNADQFLEEFADEPSPPVQSHNQPG